MPTTDAANLPPVPVPVTILIVEDDLATSEFFADLLDFAGYHTRVAASGTAALAAFPQQPIHLVLLDRRLPDMDGLDVCRTLRHSGAVTVPIILLTADHSRALGDTARAAGITAYLSKPVDPHVLLDRIAALLHAS
jgi:DNA-binding response OmpR family regulator